jgi:phage portal protein BeeE
VLISSLPIEISNPGFSPEEMILDKVRAIPVTRICAAMGIDPMVIGLPSDTKTYANYEEAIKAAYYRTIIPLHRRTDKQLTRQCVKDVIGWVDGDKCGRDYSDVECMKQDYTPMLTPLTQAVGKPWMTPNEARSYINLEKMEGADELYEEPPPVVPGDGGSTDRNMAQARKLIAASWAQQ